MYDGLAANISKPKDTVSMKDEKVKVGCVGGGQLGRMMALEAPRLNISMVSIRNI